MAKKEESGRVADDVILADDDQNPSKGEPNLMFVGEKHDREPITKFNDGMDSIRMPPVEEQLKPFYHKDAGRILRLWPKLYKAYVAKGDK